MGLFDKRNNRRKSEEFDSPVEQVDLGEVDQLKLDKESDNESEVVETQEDEQATAVATPLSQDYGIEEAIALMRTLPKISVELVVSVVRQTLESTNIDIPIIIEDATKKENRINENLSVLRMAITDLEEEIRNRKDDIEKLEADLEETGEVKERLELAVKLAEESTTSTPPKSPEENKTYG